MQKVEHNGSSQPGASFLRPSTYSALPARLWSTTAPTAFAALAPVALNFPLARALGVNDSTLVAPDTLAILGGATPAPGLQNIALAYAGHQFGHFNPAMGDGRAVIIGEIRAPDGTLYDAQLKGSGATPYARRGDGRATLPAMLREYIVSDAMAGLKIPTTRSLAVVATGETVHRDLSQPGAILTRIARSHVRVGTFQFAANEDAKAGQGSDLLRSLTDQTIRRLAPEVLQSSNPPRAFYEKVVTDQAALIAAWMGVGFIHGVMNTDNMSVAGESIDFGPCAFMDAFHPEKVFSSIDGMGRYAYNRQPQIAVWNLARLGESLLPLFDADQQTAVAMAKAALDRFGLAYGAASRAIWSQKLGLSDTPENNPMIAATFSLLTQSGTDFTLFFRRLTQIAGGADPSAFLALFVDPAPARDYLESWRRVGGGARDGLAAMRGKNPIYIPRNHRVEQALANAVAGDLSTFERLCTVLAHPFDEQGTHDLESPPLPEEVVTQTFCGT